MLGSLPRQCIYILCDILAIKIDYTLKNIHSLAFMMEALCVYSDARNEYFNIM
jgi:hypothetical protein